MAWVLCDRWALAHSCCLYVYPTTRTCLSICTFMLSICTSDDAYMSVYLHIHVVYMYIRRPIHVCLYANSCCLYVHPTTRTCLSICTFMLSICTSDDAYMSVYLHIHVVYMYIRRRKHVCLYAHSCCLYVHPTTHTCLFICTFILSICTLDDAYMSVYMHIHVVYMYTRRRVHVCLSAHSCCLYYIPRRIHVCLYAHSCCLYVHPTSHTCLSICTFMLSICTSDDAIMSVYMHIHVVLICTFNKAYMSVGCCLNAHPTGYTYLSEGVYMDFFCATVIYMKLRTELIYLFTFLPFNNI